MSLNRSILDRVMTFQEAFQIVQERDDLNDQLEITYEPHPYDEIAILNQRLRRYGYRYQPVYGDGNCVARSIADQIFFNENRHKEVREAGVARMILFSDLYRPMYEAEDPIFGLTYDQYVRHVSRNKTNIHPLFTQAICDAYGVRIVELVSNDNYSISEFTPTPTDDSTDFSVKTIYLVSSSGHTDSMYPL